MRGDGGERVEATGILLANCFKVLLRSSISRDILLYILNEMVILYI